MGRYSSVGVVNGLWAVRGQEIFLFKSHRPDLGPTKAHKMGTGDSFPTGKAA
jgi:hypothetical protein